MFSFFAKATKRLTILFLSNASGDARESTRIGSNLAVSDLADPEPVRNDNGAIEGIYRLKDKSLLDKLSIPVVDNVIFLNN
jgi:hypothetical protein